jgi:predicted nucleic acid-binding protein
VIYLDASVALAAVLDEDRRPSDAFWREPLVASALLRYEAWTALHARGLSRTHGPLVREVLQRVGPLEMTAEILERALEPFPVPLRTLDALHVATADFLRRDLPELRIATYDTRLARAAQAIGFEVITP